MNEYDELTDLVTSPKKETPIWRVYGWPAAYVVACLLWCFAIPQLMQVVSFRWMETLVCVVIGSTLGMISFAACVAGLWRRTWLSAFFVGAGLCWLGVFFGHLGSLTDWSSASVVSFSAERGLVFTLVGIMPSCILLASASLLTLRFTRNWQLVSPAEVARQQSLQLTDLFYFMVMFAACIAVMRGANTISGITNSRAQGMSIGIIVLVSVSNIVVSPLVVSLWLGKWRQLTILGIIGVPLFALGCTLGIAEVFVFVMSNTHLDSETAGINFGIVSAGFGAAYLGIASLKLGGWRLSTRHDLNENATSEATPENPEVMRAKLRKQSNVQVAVTLLLILGISIWTFNLKSWRTNVVELRAVAEGNGGQLEELPNGLYALRIPQQATDEVVWQFTWLKSLREIDVSGDDLTDMAFGGLACGGELETLRIHSPIFNGFCIQEMRLSKLRILDLSDCQLYGPSLAFGLTHCVKLEEANFSGVTELDSMCDALAGLPSLKELNLSESDISKFGVTTLASSSSLSDLKLDDTNLSAACLAELASFVALERLSLRNTNVDENMLSATKWTRPVVVVVEPNKFTEAAIGRLNQVKNLTIDVSPSSPK